MADDQNEQRNRYLSDVSIISLFAAAIAAGAAAALTYHLGLTNPIFCAAVGAVVSAIVASIVKTFLQDTKSRMMPASLNHPKVSSKNAPATEEEADELDVPEIIDPPEEKEEDSSSDLEARAGSTIGATNSMESDGENEPMENDREHDDEEDSAKDEKESAEGESEDTVKTRSSESATDQDLTRSLARKQFANRLAIVCVAAGITTAAIVAAALNLSGSNQDSSVEAPEPPLTQSSSSSGSSSPSASVSSSSTIPQSPSPSVTPVEEYDEEDVAVLQWTFDENELFEESISDSAIEDPIISDFASSDSTSSSTSDSDFSGLSSASSASSTANMA